jgi:hypothetical protein
MLADDSIYGPGGWCNAGGQITSANNGSSSTSSGAANAIAMARRACKGVAGMEMESLFDCRHEAEGSDNEEEDDEYDNESLVDASAVRHQQRQSFRILSTVTSLEEDEENSMIVNVDDVENDAQDQHHGPLVSSLDSILNQDLMEELQDHLPLCKRGESFWLQYSLVRDGASLDSLLNKVRDSEHTILVIETLEGEVFGAFCSLPWKQSNDYYGTGQSFLWRVKQDVQKDQDASTIQSQDAVTLPEVEVFKFAFCNHNIQLCRPDRLIVGGGGGGEQAHRHPPPSLAAADSSSTSSTCSVPPAASHGKTPEWGFGLWLEHDLLRGSSSPCLTFQSPSLSRIHAEGSLFEIRNLEVWSLTPCISVEQALHNQRQRRLLSGSLVPRALSLHRQPTATSAVTMTSTSSRTTTTTSLLKTRSQYL